VFGEELGAPDHAGTERIAVVGVTARRSAAVHGR